MVTWIGRACSVVLLVAGVCRPSALLGQFPGDSLPLSAVLQQLEAGTPRIAAAQASARAAEARIDPARRPPDPELQLGLMNRTLPGLGLDEALGMNQLQLMQMIPVGKLGLAAQVARARAASARARAADVSLEERSRAIMAFYDLYEADRLILLGRESQQLARNLVQAASTMYAVGEVRQPDVLRAQVELARMTEDVVRMESMRAAAAARLSAVLALPSETSIPSPALPVFPAELPPQESLQSLALTRRPMIRAGAEELRASTASERLAAREIWPDVEVGVQYGWRPMADGTDHMLSLMVGLRLPIWAGSRQLAMRRETRAMREMAAAELGGLEASTRGRIGELYAGVGRARSLLHLYRTTVLPQAEATVSSALATYRVGGVDFMTLLDARISTTRYHQEVIRLQAELGRTLAELEMVTGIELVSFVQPSLTTARGGTP